MEKVSLVALKASIRAWMQKLKFAKEGNYSKIHLGSFYCPLCMVFNDDECKGCPIRRKTGYKYCHNTPFENVEDIIHDYDDRERVTKVRKETLVGYIKDEVTFLKSLLPKKKKKK